MADEIVEIHRYDSSWPDRFAVEAAAIHDRVGALAVRIHHVGSTAVSGLGAKPIIDICVESAVFPPDAEVISALMAIGYEHMGTGSVEGQHWFKKGAPRSHHLHWCPVDGDVVRSQVRFRDLLRGNPLRAAEYEACKRKLAGIYGIDRLEYVKAKEPVIRRILSGS